MVDTTAADALVLFGATGDLSKKMLLPALYMLHSTGQLSTPVVAVIDPDWSHDELISRARESAQTTDAFNETIFNSFAQLLHSAHISFDAGDYPEIKDALKKLGANYVAYYLAIPPRFFAGTAKNLAASGLNENGRLVVEKPFGRDTSSAKQLQEDLNQYFPESRLRRVDHFLGKSAVEDLLTVRASNALLSGALAHGNVSNIQITMAEDFDVADRGDFYDHNGTLLDVVENHLMQILAYLTMEPPLSADAVDVLKSRSAALENIRPANPEDYVRGQYQGYLNVEGVRNNSNTETYAAVTLYSDLEQWRDVPITIRSGKSLATTAIEVVIELAGPPGDYYHLDAVHRAKPNLVRLQIMPKVGICFGLLAQHSADHSDVERVTASATFEHLHGDDTTAYENVLHGAISGDPRRFVPMETVNESWRIFEPLLNPGDTPFTYQPGSMGPKEADRLVGGRWHSLSE